MMGGCCQDNKSRRDRDTMSVKKNMLIIWAVASLLWAAFSGYMFRLDHVVHRYRMHDQFMEKVARGPRADPYRYEYYRRAYDRAIRDLRDANEDLAFFFLVGIGLPGLMLAIGTAALENVDKPRRRKKT